MSVAIDNVRDAILIGSGLAVLVLLAFLRNWRLTIVAASTLPLTVISTFFFMWLFGESINLMSMGGIAVAIGLVIDDAVVVVENIHRRMLATAGADLLEIERATGELVAPVVGSTMTTVVVFAPLGFLSGVVGDFFKALSITLSVAVLISLVLALTLIPILARALYKPRRAKPAAEADAAPATAEAHEHPHGWIERVYVSTLPAMLRRPWLAGLALVVLAALGVLAVFDRMSTGFFPAVDEGGFVIDYVTPAGSSLEETDLRLRKVEKILTDTKEVATFVRRTGSEMGLFATQQNSGDILVRLRPRSERSRSADQILEDLRDKVAAAVPDTDIEFAQLLQDMLGDLEGAPTPIEVKVFGSDQAKLEAISEEIEGKLESIKGPDYAVVDIIGVEKGGPEVTWQVDPLAAGRIGLTVQQVSEQMSDAWLGDIQTELRLLDRTIPVRVRYPDSFRFKGARLPETMIRGANGKLTSASALVTISEQGGESELKRENLRQMAILTARLEGRDLGGAVKAVNTMILVGDAAAGLHVRDRRPISVAATGVPRVAAGRRHRHVAGVRRPGRAVPAVHAGRAHSCGRAAFTLRRVCAAHHHRHGSQRVVGDGADPAGRARRQERDRAAGLRGSPLRGGHADSRGRARRGAHPPAADSDDDAVHVVRAAAARARTRRWC